MKNEKIRQEITKNRIKYYEVAAGVGISPGTLSVWLREELSPQKEKLVMKSIEGIISKMGRCEV